MGVRPNSPPQSTRVSSSSPRAFRSSSRPAIGRSVAAQLAGSSDLEAPVLIPELAARPLRGLRVVDLNEAHAALDQPTGEQALAAEDLRHRFVQTVKRLRGAGSRPQLEGLGRFGLHAKRQFERGDAGFQPAVRLAALIDAAR